jgi:hypothetical protein
VAPSPQYRAELKPFGIDVLVVSHDPAAGDRGMTTAALTRVAGAMTAEQSKLYGKSISAFVSNFETAPSDEMELTAVAAQLVELAERHPAPARAAIGRFTEQQIGAFHEPPDPEGRGADFREVGAPNLQGAAYRLRPG